jgi:glucose-6-phosphate-specific signal transduction histidine kinase
VIQESLTNIRKHAAGASTRIKLDFQHTQPHILVEDDGTCPVPTPTGTGHGIAGMRERVTAVGGRWTRVRDQVAASGSVRCCR